MDFDLKRPCHHCPFRSDRHGFLRRADEIADDLRAGRTFTCHETTVSVDREDGSSDRVDGAKAQMCAGAMSVLMKDPVGPNQMMRIAQRLGVFDPDALDPDAPTFDSLRAFVAHHQHDCAPGQTPDSGVADGGEPCHIAESGCEAPAGWGGFGGVEINDEPFDTLPCVDCGMYVCATCSEDCNDPALGEGRRCATCADIAIAPA